MMKIHNNANYLKPLGPTEAEIQASIKADQKRKTVNLDSEAAEKIKKFEDQVARAKDNSQNNSGTPSKWAEKENKKNKVSNGMNPAGSEKNEPPPPPSVSHVDIKI